MAQDAWEESGVSAMVSTVEEPIPDDLFVEKVPEPPYPLWHGDADVKRFDDVSEPPYSPSDGDAELVDDVPVPPYPLPDGDEELINDVHVPPYPPLDGDEELVDDVPVSPYPPSNDEENLQQVAQFEVLLLLKQTVLISKSAVPLLSI